MVRVGKRVGTNEWATSAAKYGCLRLAEWTLHTHSGRPRLLQRHATKIKQSGGTHLSMRKTRLEEARYPSRYMGRSRCTTVVTSPPTQ